MTLDQHDIPPTIDHPRRAVRILWGFYLWALVMAVGLFAMFVATGDALDLFGALAGCGLAWAVTLPLEDASAHLRALKAGARP